MNQQKTQIQTRPVDKLAGTLRDPNEVNARMQEALATCHLVAPATAVGRLPEGCGVAMSMVTVDIENDTYDVGGSKRGLSKTVLQKLAAALGMSWDASASGRIDDGSDPYYCRWRAVGSYRNFDGQVQTLIGEKEMDLRQGSPQLEALWDRYRSKLAEFQGGRSRMKYPPKDPSGQIREMRLHIQAHAESKAQLRAIRSLGIRTSYTEEELKKPFVAAKIAFTGETKDPELRRFFAEKTAEAFLGGHGSLYGRTAGAAPVIAATHALRLPPPPAGSTGYDEEDLGGYGYDEGERKSEPPAQQPAQQQQKSETPAQTSQGAQTGGQPSSGVTMPFGRSQGVAIEDAAIEDVEWMAAHLAKQIEAGKSRFPDKDKALMNALHAEIARRESSGESKF